MLKFDSKAISEHAEAPLADERRWERIVEHWDERRSASGAAVHDDDHACFVVSVGPSRDPVERAAQLAEIVSLVRSQGGRIAGEEICVLQRPNPRTLLGPGMAERLATRARSAGATMLVLDAELSPSQTRNLEDAAGIPICDREAIILNVFLRHARTRRAQTQVSIAQLEYLRPRIRGVGLDMDQQTGGLKGARGPGETASELLARKLDDRLDELKKRLATIEAAERTQRKRRDGCHRIALVGYTNAGKTSLMNALTGAELSARDRPFETLDTTSRRLARHGREVLISDTVGFIRRFPERLLANFESTLSEVTEASLLVIVLDVSDPETALQLRTTLDLVVKMGAANTPRFYVFTKIDLLPGAPDAAALDALADGHPWAALDTRDRAAVGRLEQALLQAARREDEEATVFVPYSAGNVLSLVYGRCRVLETTASERGLRLRIQGLPLDIAKIRKGLRS